MKKILCCLSVLVLLLPSARAQKVSALSDAARLGSNALFSVSTFVGGNTNTERISFGQLRAQLSDEVNVLDFGAIAHIPANIAAGSFVAYGAAADSSTAIQNAFNAAFASGGKSNTVFFPKGIYAINTPIFVPAGINVRGVGSLHAGDFADAVTRLNTNSYSIIWQTNLTRGGLVFNNLEKKGSWAYNIEVIGHTNPLAPGDSGTGNMASSPSSTLAAGPGIFLGRSSVSDWETTAVAGGVGYAGDFRGENLVVAGFSTGIRCTANSVNFLRTHMVACDTGFQNSGVCCGGDQTHFDSCSASMRPDGVGYRFHSGGGNRGITFSTPGDYEVGTWMVATDAVVTVSGGNLELTHPASTRTNFAELWGNTYFHMDGTRVRFTHTAAPTLTPTFIWQGYSAANETGPFGSITACRIEMYAYTNLALNASITNANGALPRLLRVGPYYSGGFRQSGGTPGWVEVLNGASVPVYTARLGSSLDFAPAINQPIIFGGSAWNNGGVGGNVLEQYGRPWVLKDTPDYMEVWLASTAAGPLGHQKVILGDMSFSTSAKAPNTVTLDGLTTATATNSSILTKIIGTDGNGKHVGATLSGATWNGTTFSVTAGTGDVIGGIPATTWLSLATNYIIYSGAPNYSVSIVEGSGNVGIQLLYNNQIDIGAPLTRVVGDLQVTQDLEVLGTATIPGANISGSVPNATAAATLTAPAITAFASATNAITFGYPSTRYTFTMASDCKITNSLGITAGYASGFVLTLTNSAATNCTMRLPASWKQLGSVLTNQTLVVSNGTIAVLSGEIGNSTNACAVRQSP